MKHHGFTQLETLANVDRSCPAINMSRMERLLRWTELLDLNPSRMLSTLHETEHKSASVRAAMRSDHSALSVAFSDPRLRMAGLENDTYGEAKRFFELSDSELHRIVCFCHFGMSVGAGTTSRYIRSKHVERRHGLIGRVIDFIIG